RFVRADSSGRVRSVAKFHNALLNDAKSPVDEIGRLIKAWMAEENLPGASATLVLSRESVVIRQLQLPQAPEEEIPDLVRFQSAAKSSMPIDDLALDYLPIQAGGDFVGHAVMTTSCEKKRLH